MTKIGSYSTHGHFRAELFIIPFVLLIVGFAAFPKIKNAYGNIKLNSAIDGAISYKESIDNYYVSQLMSDSSFKLDGYYVISDGSLVFGDYVYDIVKGGSSPQSGYLDYKDNVLTDGCIDINGYSIIVSDGQVVNGIKGSCNLPGSDLEVAYGM